MKRFLLAVVLSAVWIAAGHAGAGAADPSFADAARTAIRCHLGDLAGVPGAEVFVGEVRFPGNAGPEGPSEIVRVGTEGAARSGRGILFSLYVLSPGKGVREVRASADVSITVPVVVSARNVPAGGVVGAEDIVVRRRDLSSGVDGLLHAGADAVGKRARWQLSGGVPVRREYLEDPQALRRGDAVTIVAESGPVRISGKGIALQEGRVGETVLVRNTVSGRDMSGRLAEGRVVRID